MPCGYKLIKSLSFVGTNHNIFIQSLPLTKVKEREKKGKERMEEKRKEEKRKRERKEKKKERIRPIQSII